MSIHLNHVDNYLKLNNKIIATFPFTLLYYTNTGYYGGAGQLMAGQGSNTTGSDSFLLALVSNANPRTACHPSYGGVANSTFVSDTWEVGAGIFTSAGSSSYFKGEMVTDPSALTNDLASHNIFTIGGRETGGTAPDLFAYADIAEVHVYNTALTKTQLDAIRAGTVLPENTAGIFKSFLLTGPTDLTSTDGLTTLTPMGAAMTAGATHPIARAAAAPVLSSPVGSASSATTANATVSTTVGAGTIYCLVNTNPANPTASTIKASGVSKTVTASGTQSLAITGLSASTQYYTHWVHNDGSQDSTVVSGTGFTTPALPAAILSSPQGTPTGTTSATATVATTVGSGTLYFMVSANATETAGTVKSSGASQAVSASGTQNVAFSGLSASTLYYTHFVQVANALDSNVANGSGFTTPSASAAVLSSPSASAVANTTATANVTTNTGSGTLYCLASTNATETVAAIKASGASKTVSTTGAQTLSLNGLTQGTQYYLHFVQTVTGVDSGVSNSSSFTTTAPTVTITSPSGGGKLAADGSYHPSVPCNVTALDKVTHAVLERKTGLTSPTSGPFVFTSTVLVAGTERLFLVKADSNDKDIGMFFATPV